MRLAVLIGAICKDRIKTGLFVLVLVSTCSSELRADPTSVGARSYFVALLAALGAISGYHFSRIASYVTYYFTYNGRVGNDQRIRVSTWILRFLQPVLFVAPALFLLPNKNLPASASS